MHLDYLNNFGSFSPFRKKIGSLNRNKETDINIEAIDCANHEDIVSEIIRQEPERGHWSGRFDFLLACLGTAVGLGNVWRFPFLCYSNGGGAFLIPYVIMTFVIGMPVFLVELTLGQFSAIGPLKIFKYLSPAFKVYFRIFKFEAFRKKIGSLNRNKETDINIEAIDCANHEDIVSEIIRQEPERGHWSGRFDFLLACLGTAVGLGNVWRFPFLCYSNGGGAFLIPYVIMTFVIGMPVFLVELTLGQFSAIGPLKIFKYLSPAFKGLGYAIIIASTFVCIYYNVIISWTIFYFFDSARSVVNWQFCDHSFNTEACFREADYSACKMQNSSHVFFNRTCYNSTYAISNNITEIPAANRISPAQEYFNFYVLNISSGIEDIGSIEWKIALCLLVSWIVVVISLIKGIKSSGKVVYFTATFPYVILFILFIRGVTLEGATEGLKFYLIPDFSKLSDIKVWEAAAIQVFYSFSIGGGGMLTYASYNRFKNNLIKDVLIIGIADMY
ncbi:sodium-dependent proline transporter-like [Centruroides sculpturatus]|uniref:sodium-dependent proline transporter-like n=1 Tax=Centruroides sculpturatus TaxID=218467 RepID=UPI000C6EAAFE|nr:sodium-dependent proline transporter-like [Centruroides sculpturatus]